MKIFTAQQMRELDRLTVERCGIPYATLMETAGARVVEAMEREYGSLAGKSILILCGKGNNGGDGAVIARHLWLKGATVGVVLCRKIDETKGETQTNLQIVQQLNQLEYARYTKAIEDYYKQKGQSVAVGEAESTAEISEQMGFELFRSAVDNDNDSNPDRHRPIITFKQFGNSIYLYGADIVVDALLGTGLSRPADRDFADFIQTINHYRRKPTPRGGEMKIVSVDIPSGLSSDHAQPIGPHVQADLTVSFTGPKIGNVLAPACEANGKLVIAPIGTPEWLFAEVNSQLNLVEEQQIAAYLQASRRPAHAHKSAVGDVLIIAGSRGKTGAAALTAETVLRSGAGLVTVATAHSAQALLVTQALNEVMTEPLDELENGAIAHTALARALELADKRTVLALGPGLSSSAESTRQFVRQFVAQRQAPLLIDADGLNALAPWPAELKGSKAAPLIITPHPGEMARLTGKTTAEIAADRLNIAREFATKQQVFTVLKGSRTLIAAPDGEVYVNPTGNAGMATAGAGDVLTGLIAGLLAQGPTRVLNAVLAGVYLHGLAGDLAAEELGQRSLLASDIIRHLSAAILRTGGAAERGQHNTITFI